MPVASRSAGRRGRPRCLILLCWLAVGCILKVHAQDDGVLRASVWITTPDETRLLAPQAPVEFLPDDQTEPRAITIDVDDSQRFQTIHGFGGAMTDSAAWLIGTRMNTEQRDELMRALFDPQTGLGLSTVRHPAGASDFALYHYSYDDLPAGETDEELVRFSIDHDREYIIPLLQQALALNSQLNIIGTPWAVPGWMKTSDSLIGGSLRLESYEAYANYLVRYVQAFAAEGVPLAAITPINEPLFVPPAYPGMYMDAENQTEFIKTYLGPAFAAAGLTTQILIFDQNWDRTDFPIHVLNDQVARAFVAGTAFHCYHGSVAEQSVLHELHPDKIILVSECSGLVGSNFGEDIRWTMRNLFIGATRNWATDVLLWNLALDQSSGPTSGGCPNCRGVVTIDQTTGAVSFNVEYYLLGHASFAARPGAIRVASPSNSGGIETVAFLNPDGAKGLLVLNDGGHEETFKVRWAGLSFSYALPPGAVATFRWP